MGYAVEMFFDKASEDKIKSYFKRLHDLNLSKILYELNSRPHISLAVYNEINLQKFQKEFIQFIENRESMKLSFESLGIFPTQPGVVYLAPSLNNELWEFHREYHEYMDKYIKNEWTYYLPNRWVPHCAIAVDVPKQSVSKIIDEILNDFHQFDFHIEEIGIVKFRPVEEIEVFTLR